jgi:YHS domain-containing protein
MDVDTAAPDATVEHAGRRYVFCSVGCRDAFTTSPERFLSPATTP